MKANVSYLNVALPVTLKEKAHVVAKQRRSNVTALICEALAEKIEALEVKERERIAQQKRDQEEAEALKIGRRALRSVAASPLAPKTGELAPDPSATATLTSDPDEDSLVYEEHARKILDAIESETERNRLAQVAIADIKSRHPISQPNDKTILARLEVEVRALQNRGVEPSLLRETTEPQRSSPISRMLDRLIGHMSNVINPSTNENK